MCRSTQSGRARAAAAPTSQNQQQQADKPADAKQTHTNNNDANTQDDDSENKNDNPQQQQRNNPPANDDDPDDDKSDQRSESSDASDAALTLPLRWTCACKQTELELKEMPLFRTVCFCDDCHARVALLNARHPGAQARLNRDGGVDTAAWWGADVRVLRGADNLAAFRAARCKSGTASANDSTTTTSVYASCCGSPCYHLPSSPGWVNVYLGALLERIEPACGVWAHADVFEPPCATIMCSLADKASGLKPPRGGHALIPWSLTWRMLKLGCLPVGSGRGCGAHVQIVPRRGETFLGRPIEYVDAESVGKLPPPPVWKPLEPW